MTEVTNNETKPGLQTTELWASAVGTGTIWKFALDSGDWRLQLAAIIGTSLVAITYVWSRTRIKQNGSVPNSAIKL